ncbi:MAG: sensor histidine kinase KdpD, partial [Gammaproteobacteria bacterium]|nr:sensor histidine kinase KdpD [Gammaproteobacteria bacterium]
AGERILVAVGPDGQAEQLVREGKRIADAFDADWIVVYVETPALLRLSDADRNRRIDVLRLAESLGAETVTLDGPTAAAALLEYASTRHATRVVVGAPKRMGWRGWLRPSTSIQLLRSARGFDLITVAIDDGGRSDRPGPRPVEAPSGVFHRERYAWAVLTTALCTAAAFVLYPRFELSNLVMVYLLGVTVAGLRLGRGPSVLTAVLNVAAFDFFFVPPRFTMAIADAQYLLTFAVMLTVALVIANLTASVRQQTRVAGARERRSALLYAMSRELAATRGLANMARVAVRHVAEVFQADAVVLLPDPEGRLRYPPEAPLERSFRGADLAVGQWVLDHGRQAGLGTDTLPAATGLYLPLGDERQRIGVLAVLPDHPRRVLLPEQRHLLETFAGQTGLALERARLAETTEATHLAAERESLRSTLLASISHDLRTPLAVIVSAAGALAARSGQSSDEQRQRLAGSIETKALEMSELISNVLDLTRFESGEVVLRRDWQALDDLVGAALRRVEPRLDGHPVEIRLAADLPPVYVDGSLIVQLLGNLFDNVAKYTPAGTRLIIAATREGAQLRVLVDDEGPGLPPGDPARLFDKFHRGSPEGTVVGVGLGLAICQAIVRAHGGRIDAQRRPGGGARVEFTLPVEKPET